MRKNEITKLGVSLALFTVLVCILVLKNMIVTAEAIDLILLFVLVVITTTYAKRTAEISDTTKEQTNAIKQQANASMKMAESAKEQLLSEAQPYLLLRLKDRVVQWNNIEPDKHRPTEFQVTIHNAGKGPAINLCTALWHPYKSRFVCERKGYLVAGEKWQTTISRFPTLIEEKEGWLPKLGDIVEQNKTGIIAVECKDIHKRTWVSYLYLEKHAQDNAFVIEGEQNIMEIKSQ